MSSNPKRFNWMAIVFAIIAQGGYIGYGCWLINDLGNRHVERVAQHELRIEAFVKLNNSIRDLDTIAISALYLGDEFKDLNEFHEVVSTANKELEALSSMKPAIWDYDGASALKKLIENILAKSLQLVNARGEERSRCYFDKSDGFGAIITQAKGRVAMTRHIHFVMLKAAEKAAKTESANATWWFVTVAIFLMAANLLGWLWYRSVKINSLSWKLKELERLPDSTRFPGFPSGARD